MVEEATATTTGVVRCLNCGFEAPAGSDEWEHVELPGLGTLTQCPDCESTNTSSR
jgi:DNA-directed RNA polymerase subunit RPC12/RpoP